MIPFAPLRTQRLDVRQSELVFEDAIYLCKLPVPLIEANTTEMLKRVCTDGGQFSDPLQWTVQERALAMAHYTSSVADDDPDFAIGEHGRLSDYQIDDPDYVADGFDIGEVGGDTWQLHHLLGEHSEAVERLVLSGRLQAERPGWIIGCMAAQLTRNGEPRPTGLKASELEAHIEGVAKVIQRFPERDMARLILLYMANLSRLDHLFSMTLTDEGIAFLPKKGGAAALPPARFPVSAALCRVTRELFGKPD